MSSATTATPYRNRASGLRCGLAVSCLFTPNATTVQQRSFFLIAILDVLTLLIVFAIVIVSTPAGAFFAALVASMYAPPRAPRSANTYRAARRNLEVRP
jgi:hypothetical protein